MFLKSPLSTMSVFVSLYMIFPSFPSFLPPSLPSFLSSFLCLCLKAVWLMSKQCFFTYFYVFHNLRQEEICHQVIKHLVFSLRTAGRVRAWSGCQGVECQNFPCAAVHLTGYISTLALVTKVEYGGGDEHLQWSCLPGVLDWCNSPFDSSYFEENRSPGGASLQERGPLF